MQRQRELIVKVRSAIIIQRVYKGYRTRKVYKQMKGEHDKSKQQTTTTTTTTTETTTTTTTTTQLQNGPELPEGEPPPSPSTERAALRPSFSKRKSTEGNSRKWIDKTNQFDSRTNLESYYRQMGRRFSVPADTRLSREPKEEEEETASKEKGETETPPSTPKKKVTFEDSSQTDKGEETPSEGESTPIKEHVEVKPLRNWSPKLSDRGSEGSNTRRWVARSQQFQSAEQIAEYYKQLKEATTKKDLDLGDGVVIRKHRRGLSSVN